MRSKTLFALTVLLVLILAGCNLPISATKTPEIVFPTQPAGIPTETSVFAATLPPTVIYLPAVTNTFVPPTALPTSTNTNIPPTPLTLSTATLVPTITLTQPPRPTSTMTPNPRLNASAAFLSTAPGIDGPWDDWSTTQYPLQYVVWKAANWSGEDDLQASYRVGWDNNYLYLAVKVFDDVYAQHATGANMFLGDSIELLLSTAPNSDSAAAGLAAHDYQIGISPGNPGLDDDPEAYLWFPKSKEGKLTNVPIGVVSMSGGYRIEFAIPWSVFGVTPSRGQVYGFAISISDNDRPGEDVQQTMISNVYTRVLANPSSWGLVTLK